MEATRLAAWPKPILDRAGNPKAATATPARGRGRKKADTGETGETPPSGGGGE